MKKFIKGILSLDIKKLCILIFLIALIPRFSWFFIKGRHLDITVPVGGDSVGYDTLAQNLLTYHQLAFKPGKPTAFREPLYPYFLAGVYAIFGHSYNAARMVQVIISAFTCVVVFLLATKLFDKKVALLASFVTCFYPYLIYHSTTIIRETFFTFLLICAVYFLSVVNISKNRITNTIFSGIFVGLCTLVNSTSMPFVVLSLIILLLIKRVKNAVIIFFIFLILYFPWIYRNYEVFNTFILGSTAAGDTLYNCSVIPYEVKGTPLEEVLIKEDKVIQEAQTMPEPEANKFLIQNALRVIRNNPKEFLTRCIKRFLKLYRFYPHPGKGYAHSETLLILASLVSYGTIFPFFVYGLFISLKRIRQYLFLYLPIFSFTLVHTFTWALIRYRLPLEPYIIILGSYGILQIFGNREHFIFRFISKTL